MMIQIVLRIQCHDAMEAREVLASLRQHAPVLADEVQPFAIPLAEAIGGARIMDGEAELDLHPEWMGMTRVRGGWY